MLVSAPIANPTLIAATAFDLSDSADVLVFGIHGEDISEGVAAEVDAATGGMLSRLVAGKNLKGEAGELTLLPGGPTGVALFCVVGLGDAAEVQSKTDGRRRTAAFDAAAAAVRKLMDRDRTRIVIALAGSFPEQDADSIVSGALFGCEIQAILKTDKKPFVPQEIVFVALDEEVVQRGEIVGSSINHTRRLINLPANEIYPESFAAAAQEMADSCGIEIEVWDPERLESEGCRAMMAVGRASVKKPRLVIFKHNGGGQSEPPLAIVGKGVTFDSGGLSLKPSDSMLDMKCDMAGAATVCGVMRAIAKLGVKRNVIGLCGLAENMISGDAYRLGDIIETRSGKTIEIHNTDAEGRVVLADTLDVAVQHQPAAMIDLATLTGACVVALGNETAGLMSNNDEVLASFRAAADAEGEYVWPLPMFELFDEKIKSKVADIKNVGNGRWGGAITAAKFLEQFVGDVPWCHIDIAGPSFAEKPLPHRDAGATGVMVRSLIRWIETYPKT